MGSFFILYPHWLQSCQILACVLYVTEGDKYIPAGRFKKPRDIQILTQGDIFFYKNRSLTHSPCLFLIRLLYSPSRRPFVCKSFEKVRLSNPDDKFSPIRYFETIGHSVSIEMLERRNFPNLYNYSNPYIQGIRIKDV